eukprot:CAMPEP_0201532220 /NCGR_PEP_ID=MMETSP0161_2-20130828/49803_1 /ASSEMBLY_ACC=CAM_ASM_000251 /TAXON_ID=180227 /ORGANISM="Neoparamoeba aestuarina, Strain SoJaBio B1-5/56/2" /LENGTH=32 /DNA_ID= /DNA_START= /DNA_END= /DNA_ORIENTATION=
MWIKDDPKDIAEWKGVTIEDDRVIKIDWSGMK